jgi:hypothetical protein
VKQYPWKFKLNWTGVQWGQSEVTLGSDRYFYYFQWGLVDRNMRAAFRETAHVRKVFGTQLFGIHKFWYDCPHAQLNLYYFVIYWSTPWTNMPNDYWK